MLLNNEDLITKETTANDNIKTSIYNYIVFLFILNAVFLIDFLDVNNKHSSDKYCTNTINSIDKFIFYEFILMPVLLISIIMRLVEICIPTDGMKSLSFVNSIMVITVSKVMTIYYMISFLNVLGFGEVQCGSMRNKILIWMAINFILIIFYFFCTFYLLFGLVFKLLVNSREHDKVTLQEAKTTTSS